MPADPSDTATPGGHIGPDDGVPTPEEIEAGRPLFAQDCGFLCSAVATDRLPEMAGRRADVVFLPVAGGDVMDEAGANGVAEAVGARQRVALFLVGDRFRRLDGFSIGPEES